MTQTRRRRYERIGLDVDSSCRIIRRELEVADSYTRKAIEGLQSDVLAERNTIENCAKRSNPKFVGMNRPSEVRIMQKGRGECDEPPDKDVSIITQEGRAELTLPGR
jgi:hypothetical protein